MKAGKKTGKKLHVLEDDELNSTKRNVAKKQISISVKSELQIRKSSSDETNPALPRLRPREISPGRPIVGGHVEIRILAAG